MLQQRRDSDRAVLQMQFACADVQQVEHVADDLIEVLRGIFDVAYGCGLRGREFAIRLFQQQFGKAQNGRQRGSQFMRGVAQKPLGQMLRGERLLLMSGHLLLQLPDAHVGYAAREGFERAVIKGQGEVCIFRGGARFERAASLQFVAHLRAQQMQQLAQVGPGDRQRASCPAHSCKESSSE